MALESNSLGISSKSSSSGWVGRVWKWECITTMIIITTNQIQVGGKGASFLFQQQNLSTLMNPHHHHPHLSSISPNTHNILRNRTEDQLAPYPDHLLLNIESSIPLLHSANILQVIENIQGAKKRLEEGQQDGTRLREEARFVYCLWKMVDQEEMPARQLKNIVLLLNHHFPAQLTRSLAEIYPNQEDIFEFVEAWRVLMHDSQYYRSIERIERSRQARQRERSAMLQLQTQNIQIRDYFLNSKEERKGRKSVGKSPRQERNKQNSGVERLIDANIISRLYQADKYKNREILKKLEQERRERQQLQPCTFKPDICHDRLRSASTKKRSTSINGYQKTVHRMKVAQEKTRIQKQKRQYQPIGQNYEKMREKKPNPPSFLQRKKKQQDKVQFAIEFDLGRNKVKAKVHQNDSEDQIAVNLCKIYCLKQDYYDKIVKIIKEERTKYLARTSA